jgi:hypothetical protein
MAFRFRVRRHPLGVVIDCEHRPLGELLIPGEDCCGIPVGELERIADTVGFAEVADEAAANCEYLCPMRGVPADSPL